MIKIYLIQLKWPSTHGRRARWELLSTSALARTLGATTGGCVWTSLKKASKTLSDLRIEAGRSDDAMPIYRLVEISCRKGVK